MPHHSTHPFDRPQHTEEFVAEPPVHGVSAPPVAAPQGVAVDEIASVAAQRPVSRLLKRHGGQMLSFFASVVLHTLTLVMLACLVLVEDAESRHEVVLIPTPDTDEPDLSSSPAVMPDVSMIVERPVAVQAAADVHLAEAPNIASPFQSSTATATVTRPADLTRDVTISQLLLATNAPVGGGFEGRTSDQRARLVAQRGGSPESEAALELALTWLVAHQHDDGGWRLNHQVGPCDSRCANPGTTGTSTGATALALLPFLGAGYTHQQGKYADVVDRGLYYLYGRMLQTRHGGDLQEGTMYAQGIAAIALCEAYAMTGDEDLRPYAQQAIDFIVHAQHPRGGWRYVPGSPGDTTVTGWQVMALKSARLARLEVPSHTTEMAKEFLGTVQDYGGAFYGYQASDKQPGPTAVGLLLRMYLGWHRDRIDLVRGAMYLGAIGPSKTDMYFNYYATQVLHHKQGEDWQRWNARMRDYLIETQATSGHERGSWFFPDRHGSVGGRLYTTAICAMILEVYYRHMPLYGEDAVVDAF